MTGAESVESVTSGPRTTSLVPDKPRYPVPAGTDSLSIALNEEDTADHDSEDAEDRASGEEAAIAVLEASRDMVTEEDGSFMSGFSRWFDTWDGFLEELKIHADNTNQLLSKRSSYSSKLRNSGLTPELYQYYAENRRITDPFVFQDVAQMWKAGSSAKGVLQHLRETTGKTMLLRDVHNMLAAIKRDQRGGESDEELTEDLLREFCQVEGNAAAVFVSDSSGIANAICFQTARQKRLFKAFPEVILVDTTHCTNRNFYKLFGFLVNDVFGLTKQNLTLAVQHFKEQNPAWVNIKVIVTDKDFSEKDVLAEEFPDARQILCQFHVIDLLRRKAGNLCKRGAGDKKSIQHALQLMMNFRSAEEYQTLKDKMLVYLGKDTTDPFFLYFEKNWENCRRDWVDYHRDNVPHLNNHTNNRIESGWGTLKQKVDRQYSIDELISTVMLQEWSEDRYLNEFKGLGTHQTPLSSDAVDPELRTLAVQPSPYAYRMVAAQYQFATRPNAKDVVELTAGKAVVKMRGEAHTVVTEARVRVQHVIFYRVDRKCESAIPPPRFYTTRWSLLAPENNISQGPTNTSGTMRVLTCTSKSWASMARGEKYGGVKAVCQKLQGVMLEQSGADFDTTLRLLETIKHLCRAGEVLKLVDAVAVLADDAEVRVKLKPGSTSEDTKEKSAAPTATNIDAVAPKEGFRFSSAPKSLQIVRRKAKKAEKTMSLHRIPRRAKLVVAGKSNRIPTLEEVDVILSECYSFALASRMVETLPMEETTVMSKVTVQRMNVGQPIPKPKALLPSSVCRDAMVGIEQTQEEHSSAQATIFVAKWDDFGFALEDQLRNMVLVNEARLTLPRVEKTMQLVQTLDYPMLGTMNPFNDCVWLSKEQFIASIRSMTLSS
ncbi:hypothetical protein BBJ28_00004331 [Nothophytophthora sp. Chile5]|nr:hypothetical protein BBJ28_00004331 [Nothophytophthora sp. Chile5]